MAATYNVYASNLNEGTYAIIQTGLTKPEANIAADDPDAGGVKYLKVAAVNEAGEGFLSKPAKMTFIGKAPQPEILNRFNGGFFLKYGMGNLATSTTLKQSLAGGDFTDADTSSSVSKDVMAYTGSQNAVFQTRCVAENSQRTSDPTTQETPQNFNLVGDNIYYGRKPIYRSIDSGATWSPVTGDVPAICMAACYLGDNIVLVGGYIGEARSTDGGATWKINQDGVTPLAYCYLGNGITLRYKINTLDRSTDYGQTWSEVMTLEVIDTNSIFANYNFTYIGAGAVIFGYQKGAFISEDKGATWTPLNLGGVSSLCYLGQGKVWAGTESQGLWLNQSYGRGLWTRPFPYLNSIRSLCYVNRSEILVGTKDQGLWTIAGSGEIFIQRIQSNEPVYGVVHSGKRDYLAIVGNKVYKSENEGYNWTLTDFSVSSLVTNFAL